MQTLFRINLFITFLILLFSCQNEVAEELQENEEVTINDFSSDKAWRVNDKEIRGYTQGTTFLVKTSEDSLMVSPEELDSLLHQFDLELSGYIDHSLLSMFNASDSFINLANDNFFRTCYHISQDIFERTDGYFDPSVFPLVKAWGFFKDVNHMPTEQEIDSILGFTGFKANLHHKFQNDTLFKIHPNFSLDFNAIAQGQSVDEIVRLLKDRGHENLFVEVGGELFVSGLNDDEVPWIIGIDEPVEGNEGISDRKLENYLSISDKGVATSGNYRKFYEKDGKKYSHTLNPLTGYPVEHNLLSATVIAPNTAAADGYATAFMAMGVEKTMAFLSENEDLQLAVYLLFENKNGRIERAFTPNMNKYFLSI